MSIQLFVLNRCASTSSSGFPENSSLSVTTLIVVCVVLVVQVVAVLEGPEVLGQLVLVVLHLPCLCYTMCANNILYVSNLSFLLLKFNVECKKSYKLKLLNI